MRPWLAAVGTVCLSVSAGWVAWGTAAGDVPLHHFTNWALLSECAALIVAAVWSRPARALLHGALLQAVIVAMLVAALIVMGSDLIADSVERLGYAKVQFGNIVLHFAMVGVTGAALYSGPAHARPLGYATYLALAANYPIIVLYVYVFSPTREYGIHGIADSMLERMLLPVALLAGLAVDAWSATGALARRQAKEHAS